MVWSGTTTARTRSLAPVALVAVVAVVCSGCTAIPWLEQLSLPPARPTSIEPATTPASGSGPDSPTEGTANPGSGDAGATANDTGPAAAPSPPPPAPRPRLGDATGASTAGEGPAVLLRNGAIMTAAGPTLERSDVLIVGDTIRAVGRGLRAPERTTVIELAGRTVTPGIIDPHSHLGVYPSPRLEPHADGNEATGPFKPEVRALEGFWPQDPGLRTAIAGGVSTIHVLPGSANLVGGQGATLHVIPARGAAEMELPGAPATMKMACGENPKRVYGRQGGPATRMAEVAALRQKLEDARAYTPKEGEPRDFAKLALKGVVTGETLIQNHCYRADEMLARLALFGEFGVRPRAFHHATEAYKIRDVLAREGVGAVVWADWWGSKLEMLDAIPANAALLDTAGVRVALHSDSADDIQRLNQQAGLALAAGLRAGLPVDRDRAIRWITANPAWILGIDERVGTIEPGKQADLTVWSGDPFSIYTRADAVYIAGRRAFDASDPKLWPSTDADLVLRPPVASPPRTAPPQAPGSPRRGSGRSPR